MTFGEKLSKLRRERGFSQENLARELKVTRQAISNWERNKTQPDLEMVSNLAKILQTDVNELLMGIDKQEAPLNLKVLTCFYVISIILVLGYPIFLLVSPKYEFSESYVMLFIFLIIQTTIYFSFTSALKTGDYTMLAGYDSKVNYHQPILKKMIYQMAFHLLLSTLVFITINLFFMVTQFEFKYEFVWLIVYFSDFIGSVFIINAKYRDQLFVSTSDCLASKIGNRIVMIFIASIVVLVISLIGTMIYFEIENNSLVSIKLLGYFFGYLSLNVGWLMFESSQVKKKIEHYHPSTFTWFVLVVSFAFILGMIYTGYQTTL